MVHHKQFCFKMSFTYACSSSFSYKTSEKQWPLLSFTSDFTQQVWKYEWVNTFISTMFVSCIPVISSPLSLQLGRGARGKVKCVIRLGIKVLTDLNQSWERLRNFRACPRFHSPLKNSISRSKKQKIQSRQIWVCRSQLAVKLKMHFKLISHAVKTFI